MPVNDYLAFAVGEDANVMDQEDYAALPALESGFQTGVASSQQLNKVWRQASVVAAAIAEFICSYQSEDVLDDGDVASLATKLATAITAHMGDKYDKSGGIISGNATVEGLLTAEQLQINGEEETTEVNHTAEFGITSTSFTTTNERYLFDKNLYFGGYSTTANGYTRLPNGFIMQFGFIPYADNTGDLTGTTTGEKVFSLSFPVVFPNACLSLNTTICIAELEVENDTWSQVYGVTASGATILNQTTNAESSSQQPYLGIYWQAIGY